LTRNILTSFSPTQPNTKSPDRSKVSARKCDLSVKQMFRTWMKTLLHCGFG